MSIHQQLFNRRIENATQEWGEARQFTWRARGGSRVDLSTRLESLPRLALRQRAFDQRATRHFPALFELKRSKMLSSPHAFLRGSAPLFYEVLKLRPDLRSPLPGHGWIDGDMHLENFGAFKTDDDRVVFDLNDFDETIPNAPWSDDLLRLCTSCFLSAGFTGQAGGQLIALVERLLEAHARAAFSRLARPPPTPRPVAFLLSRAEARTKQRMLDSRAPIDQGDRKGRRHFALGERYLALPAEVRREVPALLTQYATKLGGNCPGHLIKFKLEDASQRIAGTGSLGVTRLATLVRSDKRLFLYDIKEARAAASAEATPQARHSGFGDEAERVVTGARALLVAPPRRLQALHSRRLRLSFVARQFTPSEDKLDLGTLRAGELAGVVVTLGHLLGRAHRRGALELPRRHWSDAQRRRLLQQASELTAVMEGAYLTSAVQL